MGGAPDRAAGFVPGRHAIDAYGDGGFRFADMSHRGSILALPSGIHAWQPSVPLTPEDFADLWLEADQLDLVIIGTGVDIRPIGAALRERFRAAGIGVEAMATPAGARTFNVLLAEGRRIAAALIAI